MSAEANIPKDDSVTVGFLTALPRHELGPVEERLQALGWKPDIASPEQSKAGITVWVKPIGTIEVRAACGCINDMGQTSAAIETLAFLSRTRPNILFLVGIAGSLDQRECLRGDVVVASEVHWYAQTKITHNEGEPVYRCVPKRTFYMNPDEKLRLDRFLQDQFRNSDSGSESRQNVLLAPIYSWDYVVNGQKAVDSIKSRCPTAICVEMEAGGYNAATERHSSVAGETVRRIFTVRGISDYAAEKNDDTPLRRRVSSEAANVAIRIAEWILASPDNIRRELYSASTRG